MQSSRPPRKFERAIMDLLFQLNGQVRLNIAQKEESKKFYLLNFPACFKPRKQLIAANRLHNTAEYL
jgi:hypothetical protein